MVATTVCSRMKRALSVVLSSEGSLIKPTFGDDLVACVEPAGSTKAHRGKDKHGGRIVTRRRSDSP